MPLSPGAVEEKFQILALATGINLQTDEEREAAEKDAADAQEQLEKEQAKEAKKAEADETSEAPTQAGKAK